MTNYDAMKKIFLPVIPLLLIIIAGLILKTKFTKEEKEIHYHAGFLVYVDGELQDFSDSKYMEVKPCSVDGKEIIKNDQIEIAHLHDNIGDVVHVEHEGAVWGDLFDNIKYQIANSKNIAGFINGEKIDNILSYPINPYDSVIIIIGDTGIIDLNHYVTKEHIRDVGQNSETC